MVENATGERGVKQNGKRIASREAAEKKESRKKIQTRFSSLFIKKLQFFLLHIALALKKGIKNEFKCLTGEQEEERSQTSFSLELCSTHLLNCLVHEDDDDEVFRWPLASLKTMRSFGLTKHLFLFFRLSQTR